MPFGAAHTSSVHLARLLCVSVASTAVALAACSGGAGVSPAPTAPIVATSGSASSPAEADPSTVDALDAAERTLATSAGDCAAACEALRAIVDARTKLCAPKTDACDDARKREDEARRTTNETCGDCAGGE